MKPALMLLALAASAAGATQLAREAQGEWWTPGFNARVRIEACGENVECGRIYYGMRTGTEARGLSMAFTTFVLFQFLNVFNHAARTVRRSAPASATTACCGCR